MKISEKVEAVYNRLEHGPLNPVWISAVPRASALAQAHELEGSPRQPLTGMTFAVKAGMLTGAFYVQAAASFLIAVPMALYPDYGILLFGVFGEELKLTDDLVIDDEAGLDTF